MSTLNVSNITDGTTTVGTGFVVNGSAKAWATFDQNTPTIVDSINTSSLTDTATGKGDLNWTSAMSNTLYSVPTNSNYVSSATAYAVTLVDDYNQNNRTASKWYFRNAYANNASAAFFDSDRGQVVVLGDLA